MPEMELSSDRDALVRRMSREMCSGSDDAFRLVYETYFDRLYRHLLVRTHGDETLARELVQQVLLKVVRHKRQFESEALLWAWLKQVGHSCHVDWMRRNHKFQSALEINGEIVSDFKSEPDDDLHLALEDGLGTLDGSERELVEWSYFESLSHRSIARRLSTTEKAVESKLARVRQKLRKGILNALKDYALL
jgi:RNA polymerase sigma factor (sigma-70 family)